jgi:hypothetical protein
MQIDKNLPASWAESLHNIANEISHSMETLCISEDGSVYEIRKYVYGKSNWSLQVYCDHNPPHFHVRSPDADVSLTIKDCELLKGHIDSSTHKKIKYWFEELNGRNKIMECWNKFNPNKKVVL